MSIFLKHQPAKANHSQTDSEAPNPLHLRIPSAMRAYSKFETELAVRPDDIDQHNHVHSTRYLEYVFAASFEVAAKHYGVSMQAFSERGLGWFMNSAMINYKRQLRWGDRMIVRCGVDHFTPTGCRRSFEIVQLLTGKRVCDGHCDYTLVNLKSGRATPLPADILEKYSI